MSYLFDKAQVNRLKEILSSPKKIIITTHHKPDGDALGSSLGLYNYLVQKSHTVHVISPSDYPDFLAWMKGNESVINYQLFTEMANELLAQADIIFCLDFNSPERVESMQENLLASQALKILIDHHLDPKAFCSIQFAFPDAAATCELVYYLILDLGDEQLINRGIAECLYAGIMTDTGSFRFPSMTASLHRVIASLMDAGARNNHVHEMVYDNYTENRLRLLGYCICDKLQVFKKYNTALITITEKEQNKFHFQTGDTEGIVNYALGIKSIKLAAFFSEKGGLVKISFRSKEGFSVKELAEKHFSGGGHKNAAGGKSLLSLQQTVDKFIALLPDLNQG